MILRGVVDGMQGEWMMIWRGKVDDVLWRGSGGLYGGGSGG